MSVSVWMQFIVRLLQALPECVPTLAVRITRMLTQLMRRFDELDCESPGSMHALRKVHKVCKGLEDLKFREMYLRKYSGFLSKKKKKTRKVSSFCHLYSLTWWISGIERNHLICRALDECMGGFLHFFLEMCLIFSSLLLLLLRRFAFFEIFLQMRLCI